MAQKKVAKPKTHVVQMAGKRKKAIARATVKKGTGIVKINNILLDLYTPEVGRLRIQEAILLADDVVQNLNITINVYGGGWSGQAEAVRLATAKALVEFTKSEDLRKRYLEYDRHLLVADTRYKETKKPLTHSSARSKRQKSYR
jgi:small subunit ribosomal protein S9